MLHDLRAIELGSSLPTRVVWQLERFALSNLRKKRQLVSPVPSAFLSEGRIHRPYVTALCQSSDGGLSVSLLNNGAIEVHEPADPDSLRFTIKCKPASHIVYSRPSQRDAVYVTLSSCAEVWRFDLDTCKSDEPSRVFRLGSNLAGSPTEIALADEQSFVTASGNKEVVLFDERVRRRIGVIPTSTRVTTLAAAENLILTAEAGRISMYDRRAVCDIRTSTTTISMGGRRAKVAKPVSDFDVPNTFKTEGFSFIQVLGSTVRLVAFQTRTGVVGYADLLSGKYSVLAEELPKVTSGLQDYGTHMREEIAWWVDRRRGSTLPMENGHGWRLFSPLHHANGFQVSYLNPGSPVSSVTVDTRKPVSCVMPCSQSRSVLVGYATSSVDLYEEIPGQKSSSVQKP